MDMDDDLNDSLNENEEDDEAQINDIKHGALIRHK